MSTRFQWPLDRLTIVAGPCSLEVPSGTPNS